MHSGWTFNPVRGDEKQSISNFQLDLVHNLKGCLKMTVMFKPCSWLSVNILNTLLDVVFSYEGSHVPHGSRLVDTCGHHSNPLKAHLKCPSLKLALVFQIADWGFMSGIPTGIQNLVYKGVVGVLKACRGYYQGLGQSVPWHAPRNLP